MITNQQQKSIIALWTIAGPPKVAFGEAIYAVNGPSITSRLGYRAGIFDKLFAKEVHTDKLCVSDDSGETCVTRSQLDSLLAGVGSSAQTSGGSFGGQGNGNGGGSSGGAPAPVPQDGTGQAPEPPPTDSGSTTPQQGSTLLDTEAPTVTLLGTDPTEVTVGTLYIDAGVTVTDNVDIGPPYVISLDGGAPIDPSTLTLDTSAPTTYTIVYSATDAAGNVGAATRTVNVVEPVYPVPPPAVGTGVPEPAPASAEPLPTEPPL